MPKRSTSLNVPQEMQARFDEITQLTDAFSETYLDDEYRDLCRQLTATMCRKQLSPVAHGKATTWAAAIIHTLGMTNFLFASSQTPHVAASKIWEHFDLSASTMQAKSKQLRNLLGITPLDVNWTLPSKVGQNPMIWMIQINGLIMDARRAPRAIQEEAFRKGLIPYIPETGNSTIE